MQEMQVWSLGWEDPPGEGKGYPLQYSGLENWLYGPWGRKDSDATEWLNWTELNTVLTGVSNMFAKLPASIFSEDGKMQLWISYRQWPKSIRWARHVIKDKSIIG